MRRATTLALVVGGVLVWLVLAPNLFVLADSLRTEAGPAFDHYARFLGSRAELRALWNSVWISLASVVLSGLIGVPLAFLFTR
ncbi:MAG: iron ABC transporter permease, partial [Longimicrobiales bacterium]